MNRAKIIDNLHWSIFISSADHRSMFLNNLVTKRHIYGYRAMHQIRSEIVRLWAPKHVPSMVKKWFKLMEPVTNSERLYFFGPWWLPVKNNKQRTSRIGETILCAELQELQQLELIADLTHRENSYKSQWWYSLLLETKNASEASSHQYWKDEQQLISIKYIFRKRWLNLSWKYDWLVGQIIPNVSWLGNV